MAVRGSCQRGSEELVETDLIVSWRLERSGPTPEEVELFGLNGLKDNWAGVVEVGNPSVSVEKNISGDGP